MLAPITKRKIGALEVLLFSIAFEVFTFDFLSAVVFIVLAVLVFLGRAQFGGDFSLAQLHGLLVNGKKQEKPTP
jgi:hypothetical protein